VEPVWFLPVAAAAEDALLSGWSRRSACKFCTLRRHLSWNMVLERVDRYRVVLTAIHSPNDGSRVMFNQFRRNLGTGIDSRQGHLDRPALVVLVVSSLLAASLLGLLWVGMFT